MNKAPINKIIECSTVDGPGCRTSIFVQKCNIHCLYCHNPETQNICNACGLCVDECPTQALNIDGGKVNWDKSKCIFCDHCIKMCPNYASPKVELLPAEEVYSRIKPNKMFIEGITVSGGECSLYPGFLLDLFKLAKEDGLTCLLDSNGMIDYSLYPELLELCDGVMLDIKSWDNDIYKKLTGYDNLIVKKNLEYLDRANKIQELRIVVVDDYVDAYTCIDGIKSIIKPENLPRTHLKLIKFRNNGVKGILSNNPSPSLEKMDKLKAYAEEKGFRSTEIR